MEENIFERLLGRSDIIKDALDALPIDPALDSSPKRKKPAAQDHDHQEPEVGSAEWVMNQPPDQVDPDPYEPPETLEEPDENYGHDSGDEHRSEKGGDLEGFRQRDMHANFMDDLRALYAQYSTIDNIDLLKHFYAFGYMDAMDAVCKYAYDAQRTRLPGSITEVIGDAVTSVHRFWQYKVLPWAQGRGEATRRPVYRTLSGPKS